MNIFIVDVFNIVGSEHCVEADDGEKVYQIIKKAFDEGKKIVISFQNVEMMTTAFLNTAVGQLYRDFSDDSIKRAISVDHISPSDSIKLRRVNQTAKMFYKSPERMQETIEDILGEENE